MLTKELAQANIQFLDRVPVTGHQERSAMNQLFNVLITISNPTQPKENTNEEELSEGTIAQDTST